MKAILTTIISLLLLSGSSVNAQVTYTISSNETWSEGGKVSYPNPCFLCTFNIKEGVVVTIEKDITFSEVQFNGGTVVINQKSLVLWTNSLKNYFSNTNIIFKGSGQLTGNGPIVMTNSTFSFFGKTNLLSNKTLEMFSSKMIFNGDSYFLGQGTLVSLANSHMVAGDGLLNSTANIKMNGAKLLLEDKTSGVDILNLNNSYFNWSDYYVTGLNTPFKTKENNKNCGGGFPNACNAPVVYGPISLTSTGFGNPLILPVVIADFTATNNTTSVSLNWATRQESNSAFFAIERSVDGSNWNQVAQVKAAGNSAVTVKYSFNDFTGVSGVAHYRLKMVDLDGQFVYSDVRSIRSAATATIKVFPNPAAEYVNITLPSKSGNTLLRLVNQAGQVVIEKNVPAGTVTINLSLNQVQPGFYVIRLSDDKSTAQSVKLMVQHK